MLWLLAAGLAYLAPAIARGAALGDYELLDAFGFGTVPGAHLHNVVSSDQVQEMIPWTDLSWVQVHHGLLPLWNPFAGLGLPLAFNFQSAAFSLPTAVSYLFPLHLAYTVTVVVKLLVAGTGATFLARTVGVRLLWATAAGTVFELSGAFTAWLGWPHTGVYCWLGWILGATLLVSRGRRPARDGALLAVLVALSVLGGHPESVGVSFVCLAVFAVVLGGARLARTARVAVGAGAGLLLASPLLVPGYQVLDASSHTSASGYSALSVGQMALLAVPRFYGLPVGGELYFSSRNYYAVASYVGLGTLAAATVAVVTDWKALEVRALAAVGAVCAVLAYSGAAAAGLSALPGVDLVHWDRAVIPLGLVLAVLAGAGLQAVADRGAERRVRLTAAVAVGSGALLLAGLLAATLISPPGGSRAEGVRLSSLVVPAVEAIVDLAAVALLWRRKGPTRGRPMLSSRHVMSKADLSLFAKIRFRHYVAASRHPDAGPSTATAGGAVAAGAIAAGGLLLLLTATPDLWSSSRTGFTATAADRQYQAAVGGARVGYVACPALDGQPNLGILAEANSAFGVAEMAAYDPVVPKAWYQAWSRATGKPAEGIVNNFCPSLGSAALARQFGVSYILVPPGAPAPGGTVPAATIAGVGLYRVPGAGVVTFAPPGTPPGAAEQVAGYTSPAPGTIHAAFAATGAVEVHIHVSDLPGWRATVDGHSARLGRWDGAMMALTVGPGSHRIVLSYRPGAWAVGLGVAAATAATLGGAVLVEGQRRRRRDPRGE